MSVNSSVKNANFVKLGLKWKYKRQKQSQEVLRNEAKKTFY